MENQLEHNMLDIIDILNDKFAQDDTTKEFEKTNAEFEKLVEQGLIKKRGNNSFSLLNGSEENIVFNV